MMGGKIADPMISSSLSSTGGPQERNYLMYAGIAVGILVAVVSSVLLWKYVIKPNVTEPEPEPVEEKRGFLPKITAPENRTLAVTGGGCIAALATALGLGYWYCQKEAAAKTAQAELLEQKWWFKAKVGGGVLAGLSAIGGFITYYYGLLWGRVFSWFKSLFSGKSSPGACGSNNKTNVWTCEGAHQHKEKHPAHENSSTKCQYKLPDGNKCYMCYICRYHTGMPGCQIDSGLICLDGKTQPCPACQSENAALLGCEYKLVEAKKPVAPAADANVDANQAPADANQSQAPRQPTGKGWKCPFTACNAKYEKKLVKGNYEVCGECSRRGGPREDAQEVKSYDKLYMRIFLPEKADHSLAVWWTYAEFHEKEREEKEKADAQSS